MEEQLKELMGENYHDGITAEEVQKYFQEAGQKSVLESGKYVNKEMADAEKVKLQKQIEEKENALKAKMTDEEKQVAAQAAKDKELQDLKDLLAKNTLSSNNYKAFGLTAEARLNADVKDDDAEFTKFIENIVSEDETKTTEISSYINKIVKAAYEKGKSDMTKGKMASMGNFNKNENNNGQDNDKGSLGERLAKVGKTTGNAENPYFKL